MPHPACALAIAVASTGAALALANPAHAKAPRQDPAVPALWSMETQQPADARKTIIICVDKAMKEGFSHSLPEVAGQPCRLAGRRPVLKGELFAARCRSGGYLFDVHSVSTGDLARDFVVDTTFETRAGERRFEQQIRYRKLSDACPRDWRIGDSGAPGETKVVNALTRASRSLDQPIAPPPR
ncbi:MAG: hypothetical protein ACXU82_07800 [Caulobacteraceae bacterium]